MSSDSDDILVEISNDEIEECRMFYKNLNKREFVYVHLYLRNQLRWNQMKMMMDEAEVKRISDRCKMKFYRHRNGKSENKTLIGITGSKEYSIFIITLDESMMELRECLEQTKLIKWVQIPLFIAVHQCFREMLNAIFEKKNVAVRIDNHCSTMWLDRMEALSYEFSVPKDLELRELNVDDHQQINDLWAYRYPGSECFIKSIIKLNGGLGIYRNDKLISWILQVECFGLGRLQTVEDHQGKGYARLLTKAMTRRISENFEEDVILFASHSKPKTVELYIRYGFKQVSSTHWIYLRKT